MKKSITLLLVSTSLFFAKNNDSAQQIIDKKIKEATIKILQNNEQKSLKMQELFAQLEKQIDNLDTKELVKNFSKIQNILKNTKIDPMITFWYSDYKDNTIYMHNLVEDDEKMRENFLDKKFKNMMKEKLEYDQNRRFCNHDKVMNKILDNNGSLIYKYYFKSNQKPILDIITNKESCKKLGFRKKD